MVLEIGSWIGLAGVRCEGASILGLLVVRESITEIVVLRWVNAGGRIILSGENINWRSYIRFVSLVNC